MRPAPEEVWLHCTRDGHWSLSFDPPRKRYAHQFHRMVPDGALTDLVEALEDLCEQIRGADGLDTLRARTAIAKARGDK